MDLLVFGCLLLLFGLYLKRFPPDYHTQRHVGYRTKRSMRNEDAWIKANKIASSYLLVFGCLNALIGLAIITSFLQGDILKHLSVLLIPLTIVLLFVLVEVRLSK